MPLGAVQRQLYSEAASSKGQGLGSRRLSAFRIADAFAVGRGKKRGVSISWFEHLMKRFVEI